MTHLVISGDELCYCMENTFPREFPWPRHRLEVQQLLLFLCCPAPYFGLFFLLHYFPNAPRNCPMSDRYVIFFTPLLVNGIMLTDM